MAPGMVLENNRTLSDYLKRVLLGLPSLEAQPKPFPEGTATEQTDFTWC